MYFKKLKLDEYFLSSKTFPRLSQIVRLAFIEIR